MTKTMLKTLNYDEMMLFYKRFFCSLGLLPFKGKNFSFIGSRMCLFFFMVWSLVHANMYIFYGINGGDKTVDYYHEITSVLNIHIRYYILLIRRREVKELFDECKAIWKQCDERGHREVINYENKIRIVCKMIIGNGLLLNALYTFVAVRATINAPRINDTDHRVLPYKWFVVDKVDAWPGYKLTFAMQVMAIGSGAIISLTVDTIIPVLVMMSSGYFKSLSLRILNIEQAATSLELASEYLACCKLHQRILNFCLKIDKFGRMLLLMQALVPGYNMSLIAIKLISSEPGKYKYLTVFVFALTQLLICQVPPDYLLEASQEVSHAMYSTYLTWMEHGLSRQIVLVILRAQKPMQITAGGIVNLSIESFGKMLYSAFSFFMVLRSLNL